VWTIHGIRRDANTTKGTRKCGAATVSGFPRHRKREARFGIDRSGAMTEAVRDEAGHSKDVGPEVNGTTAVVGEAAEA
jgi:hypothetical protein